ncbi:MAG: SusD/RagB family nutrient-binding outer membrane lipoprotein [Cyclobacterium sp.]|uniref:SusD/RagB family nutrient-binding outer membrane lipoprotein n=1 Tax=unclassified Cyclobacterium TaxID=2615055 RepID=UPI0013D7AD2D|nr:SusD/RagB family nutrient-binding outer membrane lipoprotein [Cyclobacterium sp. SYSU L10401]
MKNPIIKTIFILLTIGHFGCESIVDDLNTDPNNPTDASAELMLTGIELANMSIHEGHTARVAGMWSGYFTGIARQYPDFSNYNATGATFDQIWENIYAGVINNGNIIIEKSEALDNRLMMGIVKVIQANALGTATACWGDIPFSETSNIGSFPNPKFDPQPEVYQNLQAMLDEALDLLNSGIGSVSADADIFLQGNREKWIEVAHTLKARLYLEQRDYPAAFEEAGMGISSPENSLMAPHGTVINSNENLMFAFLQRGRSGDMSSLNTYLSKILNPDAPEYKGNPKTNEKARFEFYFLQTDNISNITPNTSSESDNTGIFARDASFPLITYQENLLIQAEAGMRSQGFEMGLEKLNAYRSYLNSGESLHPTYSNGAFEFSYEPYERVDFTAGGMAYKQGLDEQESLLNEILLERYVAFFGQKLGFIDIRRTRMEAAGVHPTPNVGNTLPERFLYSQSEINSNTNAPSPVPGLFDPTPINLVP